jgi:hypothetical protein
VNIRPWLLYPGKETQVPFVLDAGWAPGLVWKGADYVAPIGIRSPDCPAHSKLLYQLCHHCPNIILKAEISVHLSCMKSQYQWPHGLGYGSAATQLLGLRVQIPLGVWMSVSYECCVLSGTGLCVRLITHPEKSYRVHNLCFSYKTQRTMICQRICQTSTCKPYINFVNTDDSTHMH